MQLYQRLLERIGLRVCHVDTPLGRGRGSYAIAPRL
jgi:hypothetical protein